MRKKRNALLIVVLVAIIGTVVWSVLPQREPVYQGKRLSQWLDEYNNAGAMDKIETVSEAVRAMGTNSLPFLLANIKHTDSPLKMKVIDLLKKQHLVKLPFYGEDRFCWPSVMALHVLGSNAAPIFPELLLICESHGTNWTHAMGALFAIGPSTIPTLGMACHSTNADVRREAVWNLAVLKTASPSRITFGWWKKARINGKPLLWAYPSYGSTSDDFFERVTLTLEDGDPSVRRASAEIITMYNVPLPFSVRATTLAALTKALNDSDSDVRRAAAESFKKLDPQAAGEAGVK